MAITHHQTRPPATPPRLQRVAPDLREPLAERSYAEDCNAWVPGRGLDWGVLAKSLDFFLVSHLAGGFAKVGQGGEALLQNERSQQEQRPQFPPVQAQCTCALQHRGTGRGAGLAPMARPSVASIPPPTPFPHPLPPTAGDGRNLCTVDGREESSPRRQVLPEQVTSRSGQ